MKLFLRENMDLNEREVEIRCRERNREVDHLINIFRDSGDMLLIVNVKAVMEVR